nr:hypothetical protein [Candidatus Njordarchaeum guaymaensis]
MDLLTLISRGITPIIDFKSTNGNVKPFLAKYGGHLNSIGIVVKDETGRGYFEGSATPPGSPESKFLSQSADLFQTVGIKVYALVHAFLDSRATREGRFRTVSRSGKKSERFSCPANVTTQTNLVKFLEDLTSTKLVDNIVLIDNGFLRKDYCFCETCQNDFAQRNKLPLPITINTITSKQQVFDDWVKRRAEVITGFLDMSSKSVAETASKIQSEVNFYASIDLDERTGFMNGAYQNFGQAMEDMVKLSNITVRVQPWTPIIPSKGSQEYGRIFNDLKTLSNHLSDYDRKAIILTWNIEDDEELATVSDMRKMLSASAVLAFQSFPQSIGPQRDAHLGLDLDAK